MIPSESRNDWTEKRVSGTSGLLCLGELLHVSTGPDDSLRSLGEGLGSLSRAIALPPRSLR